MIGFEIDNELIIYIVSIISITCIIITYIIYD